MTVLPPDRFLFMKYGPHGSESVESILARKRAEIAVAGRMFWGYGGTLCDPSKQVQPFLADVDSPAYALLSPTVSSFSGSGSAGSRFSENGSDWAPMPKGIRVLSSRRALVAAEIHAVDWDVDLAGFAVAAGPSKGKTAADFIRFRVDKACLTRIKGEPTPRIVKVNLVLKLAAPYAVYVE